MSSPRVLIVGAGMAGLGAAHSLRRRGIDYTVLEAASYAGGRVMTEEVDGFLIDAGANVFLETYGTVKQVAEDLGVPFKRTRVPINGGTYHNGKFYGFYGGKSLSNRLKTAKNLLSLQFLSPRGMWETQLFIRMLRARSDDLTFDDHSGLLSLDAEESTYDFFESNIGTEFLDRFFQPSLSSYTFAYPDEVGVAYAMAAAWQFGMNGIAWPYMPEKGPGVFADALIKACGGNIWLDTPVERIVLEDGVAKGVVANGDFLEAEAVILATTATTVLRIASDLPSEITEALRKVTYSKCCRVVFGLDSGPLPPDWYAVAFPRRPDMLITGMSDSAVLAPTTVPEGKSLIDTFVIGDKAEELFALSDQQVTDRVMAEIQAHFPAVASTRPLFSRVYRWNEAVCLAPGGMLKAMFEMRLQSRKTVQGLFFAGDYMGVPSTNGALRSGLVAADDVTNALSP